MKSEETIMIKVNDNGRNETLGWRPGSPATLVIRDEIGLTGTKLRLRPSFCWCVHLIVNKQAIRACITSVSTLATGKSQTIEGSIPRAITRCKKSLARDDVRVGYCQTSDHAAADS